MADYSRIVSYMYNYENGAKKSNIGYARVESRNGQCKITIHIRVPSINDQLLGSYIIHRSDGHMQGVHLGNIQIRNGIGEYQVSTLTNNLMESNFRFDEMGAILVYASDHKYFGTEWDDHPITIQNFEVVKNKAEAGKQSDVVEAVSMKEKDLEGLEEIIDAKELLVESIAAVMKDSENDSSEELLSHQTIEVKQEVQVNQQEQVQAEQVVQSNQEVQQHKEIESIQRGDSRASIFNKAQQKLIYQAQLMQNMGVGVQMPKKEENPLLESVIKAQGLDPALVINEAEKKKADYFVKLFDKFPKMHPFEDDDVMDCVRIEPQDIGMLPMDNWILGNNSFLMHGYYSYRHLILAKLRQSRDYQYVIGVPGVNLNREMFMARMFGFDRFKSIKKTDPTQGEFGYYYMNIVK